MGVNFLSHWWDIGFVAEKLDIYDTFSSRRTGLQLDLTKIYPVIAYG